MNEQQLGYITGLFLTDGWLSCCKNNYYLNIELKKEDENVLEQIFKTVQANKSERTRDTNFKENYTSVRMQITDKEVIDFLLNNNFPLKNKTETAFAPKMYKFSPAFWRGAIDGDGSYGYRNKTPFIGFTTKSEQLKNDFLECVEYVTGQKIIATRNKRDNIYNLGLTSVNAKKFIEWLMIFDDFYIKRKRDIMISILNWEPSGRQGEIHKRWSKEEDDFVYENSIQECLLHLSRTKNAIQLRKTKLNKERGIKNE